MTATPGPRAMRASNARQVTATTCPLVDIQLSFCSRSASAYFGRNLPQKAKWVNGLALDLPSRDGRLAAKTRLAGCGTSACIFPRLAGHPSADSAFVWATLSLFVGRFDVPPTPLLVRPSAMTAVAVPAAAKHPEFAITHKNGPGTSVHSGSIYATRAAELQCPRMRGAPTRAYIADRFRVRRKRNAACGRFRSRSDPLARCDASEKMQAGLERR